MNTALNTHNLEKLNVYKPGTNYFRYYMFLYLYGFVVVFTAITLNTAASERIGNGLTDTLNGKGITFSAVYLVTSFLLIITAVYNAIMLPMVNKAAFYSTLIS